MQGEIVMAKGISLHIGLNRVDAAHYAGWSGELNACEADAASIEEIARNRGFLTSMLLNEAATRDAVRAATRAAARGLAGGDIFLVSYAGHGGQVPDVNGDEPDAADETWCLHDGQLIDDELQDLWSGFAPGVRVLVISDSCHSGTVTRAGRGQLDLDAAANELRAYGITRPVYRYMPPDTALRTYREHKPFYDGLGRSLPATPPPTHATVRLLSGCRDDQTSADGPFNGLFTGTLLGVWGDGSFAGDYASFHAEIARRMPRSQQPCHDVIGVSSPEFDRQQPFTI
jgi:metacaspase-1